MDFFDKLGKKASEAYKVTADKTGKIAKETKIKLKIGDLKSQISDIYEEIGKKVYEKHVREEDICIKKDLEEQCTKIDVLSDEIDSLLKQCLELKDKKQCQKCFKEIEKNAQYCPNCGAKQEELQEKVQEQTNQENEEQESEKNVETYKEDETEKDDLEKTVEIESNVNLENEDEEKEEDENDYSDDEEE